jgi:hypothetical protein
MAHTRSPDTNVESLLSQGKARASGRGEPQGFARGGRVSTTAMQAYEGSPADMRQDEAGARRMMKRGMASGGRAGKGC